MKRLISWFMTLALCAAVVCTPITAAAATDGALTQSEADSAMETLARPMVGSMFTTPAALGLSAQELSGAYLGTPFYINAYEAGRWSINRQIRYTPILRGDEVIALLKIFKVEGDVACELGVSFAPELYAYLKAHREAPALFSYEQTIYGVSPDGTVTVLSGREENAQSFLLEALKQRGSGLASLYDTAAAGGNTLDLNTLRVPSMEGTLAEFAGPAPRASSYKYLDYPIVYQGNWNICWAAVIASMVAFELPERWGNLDAFSVCEIVGHGYTWAYTHQIPGYLSKFFPSTHLFTLYNRAMNNSEIKTIINNIDPAYIFGSPVSGDMGHAVALCGYNDYGSSLSIRFMNPAEKKFAFSSSSSGFKFTSGGDTFVWSSTVRILYR